MQGRLSERCIIMIGTRKTHVIIGVQKTRNIRLVISDFFNPLLLFSVLLKSTKDEVFYDFSSSEGGIVKHLTKTVCPNTGSVD